MDLLTRENLCQLLGKARTDKGISQKRMAMAMGRSVATIQNWEYGLSTPDVIEVVEWFKVLGIHPLKYILEWLHPDVYEKLGSECDDSIIYSALDKYLREMATSREVRQLAYMVFGGTGSSWHSQVNMLYALDHLPIMDRVNIAESIYNMYEMRSARGELRTENHVKPDMEELRNAIELCKESVRNGHEDYFVK